MTLSEPEQESKPERKLVTPGDLIAEGQYKVLTPYTVIKKNDGYYALVVGLATIDDESKALKLVPLQGPYYPSPEDVVIGIIRSLGITSWEVDIRAPSPAILYATDYLGRPINPARENLSEYLDVGDVIIAKIQVFDRTRDPLLTTRGRGLGKVTKGAVIEISPVKVPRVIGKKGSMQSVLEGETGCKVIVGRNGRLVINCPSKDLEEIVVLAIRKIEAEAHTTGLTDRIKEFIITEKVRRGLISGR